MLKMQTNAKKFEDRMALVEASVFKTKQTSTIFDDIEAKFQNFDIKFNTKIEKMIDDLNGKFGHINDRIFETNNKITQNEVLKQQFQVFREKSESLDERMKKF